MSYALLLQLLCVPAFLVGTLLIYDGVNAFGLHMPKRFWIAYAPLLLLDLALIYCLTALYQSGAYTAYTSREQALLAVLVALLLAVLIGFSVLSLLRIRNYKRFRLTPASLQEGLDMLPDGICFATRRGVPLLVNSKMQSLCQQTFGMPLLDTNDIRHRFFAREFLTGCSAVKLDDSSLLFLPDGTVWRITYLRLTVNNSKVDEFVAYEVTEQYLKNRELEIRNTHLSEINRQLREYEENLDTIIREREILAAKIKLHDNLGRSLLALRAYLSQRDGDRESLLSLWRFTVSVLRREAVEKDDENRIDVLKKAAEAVEIELVFDGEIPTAETPNKLIAMAIQECLTNAVKHAEATRLFIKTVKTDEGYTVEITNDGRQPAAEITEKGGLKNLRKTVEIHGGEMEIESLPRFLLRLRIR